MFEAPLGGCPPGNPTAGAGVQTLAQTPVPARWCKSRNSILCGQSRDSRSDSPERIPALPLANCVTSETCLTSVSPSFFICEMGPTGPTLPGAAVSPCECLSPNYSPRLPLASQLFHHLGNHFAVFNASAVHPWRRKWQPTPGFLPGKSHGQRSLAGYSPHGVAKNWT